jgi:putative hemolysin
MDHRQMWWTTGERALRGTLLMLPGAQKFAAAGIPHTRGHAGAKASGFETKPMPSGSLGQIGSLEVRLATGKRETRKAQRLRYKVFFEEGEAVPDRTAALIRRDIDAYDKICDHLIVIDHGAVNRFGRPKPRVVGTYRLLRQDVAERNFGFYSAQEFDIEPLLERHRGKRFLELGRSCVLAQYRSKRTLELLWRGIKAYLEHHRIDVMIGCASFEGTNPLALALPLSFLHHHATGRDVWRVGARAELRVAMGLLEAPAINARRAIAALPPLIKGYLRLGATFGDGAVVDHQFGTTDVFVMMPIAELDARYVAHFGGFAGDAAAAAA